MLFSSWAEYQTVNLSFAFSSSEGFVGESITAQVVVKFNASESTSDLVLSELRIHFSSNFRNLQVSHAESATGIFSTLDDLGEEHDPSHPMAKSLRCNTDLRLRVGQMRVLDVAIPLREADTFKVTGASIMLGQPNAALEYLYSREADVRADCWFLQSGERIATRRICRENASTITVLPKPPKMQIRIVNPKDQYFTNEQLLLDLEMTNGEDEDAVVSLSARLEDDAGVALEMSWQADGLGHEKSESDNLEIGEISASEAVVRRAVWAAPLDPSTYTLIVNVQYRLGSALDAETPVTKSISVDVAFVSPFEANYEFSPRLHSREYPDFFLLPNLATDEVRVPHGIEQRWCLTSRIASFASEALIIASTSIIINKVSSNTACVVGDCQDAGQMDKVVEAHEMVNIGHTIDTQRYSLEDRRASALDLSLAITWRRKETSPESTTTTVLAVPSLTVPAAEPRVLCTAETLNRGAGVMTITYILENPSIHFLNFTLTMEASDAFAFSGPKFRSVSLTPVSRIRVEYNILVYEVEEEEKQKKKVLGSDEQMGWWIFPVLRVTDPYFKRSLRILDAGDGVTSDGRGNIGIWVAK